MSDPDYDDKWARGLTTAQLATGLRNVGAAQNGAARKQRIAILSEAARRLETDVLDQDPDAPEVPAKGTPEYALWIAAIDVATSAPFKQGPTVTNAGVYWPRIHALRAALEAVGIDWLKAKKKMDGQ